MMNSTHNFSNFQSADSKVKMMAHQYKRFVVKNKNKEVSKKTQCISFIFQNLHSKVNKFWNFLIPISLRGSTTPYQQFQEGLKAYKYQYQRQKLPFSSKTISNSLAQDKLTIILLYKKEKIIETLEKVKESTGIENLVKNNAQVFPMNYESQEYNNFYEQKVSEILLNKSYRPGQTYFIILWKGLFGQVLILDIFFFQEQYAYFNITQTIDRREDYEADIKTLANVDIDQYSLNEGMSSQKLTSITRSSSVSSL